MVEASRRPFGVLRDGTPVELFTLQNKSGMRVQITNYGGIVTSIVVPDRHGRCDDVVLGFDTIAAYEQASAYFGALIGRFGNRIANGRLPVNGQIHQVTINDGHHHLHGGKLGFDKVVWQVEAFTNESVLVLRHLSPDGHEGYPGNLSVSVTYQLGEDNELTTTFQATSDQATHVNLTQHSYFNLCGVTAMRSGADVLGHEMQIAAETVTPVNEALIPTGGFIPVAGTPLDFRQGKLIGRDLTAAHPQLAAANGYDHNFVLGQCHAGNFFRAARVTEPKSGRILELWTSEPGVQFYSGNFLDGSVEGKGVKCIKHSGFCLEPQHFPDTPNQPGFPSTQLAVGDEYTARSSYRFLIS